MMPEGSSKWGFGFEFPRLDLKWYRNFQGMSFNRRVQFRCNADSTTLLSLLYDFGIPLSDKMIFDMVLQLTIELNDKEDIFYRRKLLFELYERSSIDLSETPLRLILGCDISIEMVNFFLENGGSFKESDDIDQFGGETRVVGQLELAHLMWL